jgi:hypothetical protein
MDTISDLHGVGPGNIVIVPDGSWDHGSGELRIQVISIGELGKPRAGWVNISGVALSANYVHQGGPSVYGVEAEAVRAFMANGGPARVDQEFKDTAEKRKALAGARGASTAGGQDVTWR